MYIDKQLLMSSQQAVTVSAASTNVPDQAKAGEAYEKPLWLEIGVTEAATAVGAATVNFVLQTATDEAFTSPVVLFDSGAIAKTALTLGAKPVQVRMPVGALQYLRVYYTVGTGPLTAGKFNAYLTPDVKV